jgi:hypothetical protein
MNKILIITLLSIPAIALATNSGSFDIDIEKLPKRDGGIRVVPSNKMAILGASFSKVAIAQHQIKEKGYYDTYNSDAKVIMNMRNMKPIKEGTSDPKDTHLKSTIADVGLAFTFNGVPVDPKNVVGFAASGSYEKGWNGVTEIFTDPDLGSCQYSLNNIKLSHGSAFVPEEVARYDVNGKVTILDVRGNTKSGYTYKIYWADATSMNDLICADMTFDKTKTEKLIDIAKKIDKSLVIN